MCYQSPIGAGWRDAEEAENRRRLGLPMPEVLPAPQIEYPDDPIDGMKFRLQQSELKRAIARFEANGCGPIPPEAVQAATMPIPKGPTPPPPARRMDGVEPPLHRSESRR